MPSKIEWTTETLNPIRARNRETGGTGHYCVKVSDGCRNCYAEQQQARFQNPIRYGDQHRDQVKLFLDKTVLRKPLHWRKPRMVFVCSMTDLFADFIPDDWIDSVYHMMKRCPQHTFQILTKRPERMQHYWTELPNVWLGVSVEDQATADARVPILLDTPAAIRWVSYEPALGPVDFSCLEPGEVDNSPRLDWIVAGGESGNDARPCHPDWIRGVRDQCQSAGVPFFFKQWGEWVPQSQAPEGLWLGVYRSMSLDRPGLIAGDGTARKVGKKNAGAMLDGRHWQEYPA